MYWSLDIEYSAMALFVSIMKDETPFVPINVAFAGLDEGKIRHIYLLSDISLLFPFTLPEEVD